VGTCAELAKVALALLCCKPQTPSDKWLFKGLQVSKLKLATARVLHSSARSWLSYLRMIKKSGTVPTCVSSKEAARWPPQSASDRHLRSLRSIAGDSWRGG